MNPIILFNKELSEPYIDNVVDPVAYKLLREGICNPPVIFESPITYLLCLSKFFKNVPRAAFESILAVLLFIDNACPSLLSRRRLK